MNELREKREIAQSEALDKSAKIVSGLVPGGTSIYELFTALVTPLHVKRKEGWVREVTMRLHKLETEGKINMEELSRNEEFNTVITKATLLAQQNHQKEKIEALRNMVLNFAKGVDSDVLVYDQMDYYLSMIERMNPFHIMLLKIFQDPQNFDKPRWEKIDYEVKVHLIDLFLSLYPELGKKVDIVMQAWKDLYNYGFVDLPTMKSVKHTKFSLKKLTTDFGDQFLNMIVSEE